MSLRMLATLAADEIDRMTGIRRIVKAAWEEFGPPPKEPEVTRRVSKQALDWLIRKAHVAPTNQYSVRLGEARREMSFWSRRTDLVMPKSMDEWATRMLEDSPHNWED